MKLILLSTFATVAFLFAEETPRPAAPTPSVVQWEYKTLMANNVEGETERLDKLGAEGWELFSVVATERATTRLPTHLRYYFKRVKAK